MTTRRHRRASGAVRKLPSGRSRARRTGPDGALRTLGTYPTKVEADKALAHQVARMARGVWHDPRPAQTRSTRSACGPRSLCLTW